MKSSFHEKNRFRILSCNFILTFAFSFLMAGFALAYEERLTVEIGKSIILPIKEDVETVFISDTGVADATVSPGNRVFVYGKSVGETTLIVTPLRGDAVMTFTVAVTHQLSEIRSVLSSRFPDEQFSVESSRGSLLISGVVSSEQVRQTVFDTLRAASPDTAIIDRMTVSGSNVIRLQVVLLEVSRTRAESFGIDWSGTIADNGFFLGASNRGVLRLGKDPGAQNSLNAAVDLLVSSGIATIQQETILSTVTGEAAEFSVGGEIPVPRFTAADEGGNGNNFQLDYKFIGTALSFTPSLAAGNKLRLLIDSTISATDGSSASVNGNSFPNLSARSFKTSVELEDQQPFVIAGVSRNNSNGDLRQSRNGGLSRVLDSVFGNDRITQSSQELVVIVTPMLSDSAPLQLRDRLPASPSNLEFILSNALGGDGISGDMKSIGLGGFKY